MSLQTQFSIYVFFGYFLWFLFAVLAEDQCTSFHRFTNHSSHFYSFFVIFSARQPFGFVWLETMADRFYCGFVSFFAVAKAEAPYAAMPAGPKPQQLLRDLQDQLAGLFAAKPAQRLPLLMGARSSLSRALLGTPPLGTRFLLGVQIGSVSRSRTRFPKTTQSRSPIETPSALRRNVKTTSSVHSISMRPGNISPKVGHK